MASAVRVGPQGGELGRLLGDREELNRPRKDQELHGVWELTLQPRARAQGDKHTEPRETVGAENTAPQRKVGRASYR